jgi:PAS domain S-box-containing protein
MKTKIEQFSVKNPNPVLSIAIDIHSIKPLMNDLYRLVHIPIGINDLKGNVLAGVGWQDICTKFHRVHPETCKYCIESDIMLSAGVSPGEFKLYRCKNNMWDIVTPIMVGSQHVGYVFGGQFFFDDEPIDYELFRSQARKYDFNEEEYIAELEKVPRLSREAVEIGMSFFMKFANMLSELNYSNFKLAKSLSERDILLEALRESETKYRHILETAQEGIWSIDQNDRTVFVNQKISEMLGYSIDEMLEQLPQKFLAPEFRALADNRLREHRQIINQPIDYRFIRKDGSDLWCILSPRPLFDNEGKYAGSLGMLTDITKRKKAEEALKKVTDNLERKVTERTAQLEKTYNSLKESERRLSEAQRIAHIGNWENDLVFGEVYWSDEMYRIFGCNPQEDITYNKFLSYIHPDDRDYVHYSTLEAFKGKIYATNYKIIRPDGEERIVYAEKEIIFDENNNPLRMRGTVQDVTERKKAEEEIQNLANIVESSNDAIGTISLDGIITSWNEGAEQVYGYLTEEILGKNVSILAQSHLMNETKKLSELVKQGDKIRDFETTRLRKDGKVIYVSFTLSPVFNIHGKLTAISFISRDITKRKEAENALSNIEIARKKEIHHRIKNNLQVISSLLDLQAVKFSNREFIKESEVLEAFRESQDRVISMALIHEELYKGRGFETLNFSSYIEELANNLFLTYRLEDIDISLNMDLEENIFFDVDIAIPLGMIINELVSNSFKYAFPGRNEGKIRIRLHRENNRENESKKSESTTFTLTVSDDGIGIPENFDFEELDSLGLQLVISLVDQIDGEIELRRNNGTEFTINFTVTEKNNHPFKLDSLSF